MANGNVIKINGKDIKDVEARQDISDLKSRVGNLESVSDDVNTKMGWNIGDMTDGSFQDVNYRICSKIVTFERAALFRCNDGFQLYTVSYNPDGAVDKSISFRAAIQVPAKMPFALTVRRNPESTSTPADLDTFVSGIYLDKYTGTGDYQIYERGNPAQPTNPGQRADTDLIPGTVGRISIRSLGYDHFLESYALDGTKLTDTAWVTGSADYSLDPQKNYIVVFAVTSDRTTPIDFSDLSKKVAVYRVASGMPDILNENPNAVPFIQQTFVGRPTLTGANDSVLSFLWFSDIHKEQKQWDRAIQLANYYSTRMAFAIHTGDYVGNDQSNYEHLYENGITPSVPMLNVVGNHDIYTNFANRTLAAKSVTKSIIMPDTTDWGVTWGTGDYAMHYYKDFSTEKVRLVVLDDYYDTETQASWLATVLSEAKALGYHVITAAHETSRPITVWSDNGFNSKDAAALTVGGLNHSSSPYDAVIKAFKDSGGVHIAHICGHEHVDLMGKTDNGVLNIVIGSQRQYFADASDAMRIDSTRTADLVNVVGINTDLGIIKIVRVGVNTDHYMRDRNVLTYDYINDAVISDDVVNVKSQIDASPVESGSAAGSVQTKPFTYSDATITQTASGIGSFAEGYDTIAKSMGAHAEGAGSRSLGIGAHAEGQNTRATNTGAHAEGSAVIATGQLAHIEGGSSNINCTITGAANATTYTVVNATMANIYLNCPIMVPSLNKVATITAVDIVNNTITVSSTFDDELNSASAVIYRSFASGQASHAEGVSSLAIGDYSHVEGGSSMATGDYSHAEGIATKVLSDYSHTEGSYSVAMGEKSHSENFYSLSYGANSHAENKGETYILRVTGDAEATTYTYTGTGNPAVGDVVNRQQYCGRITAVDTTNKTFTVDTTLHYQLSAQYLLFYCSGAFGENSHVEGKGTTALGSEQHVQGKYNVPDANGTYAEIVGNGTAHDARSNARTLDWSGNEELAGSLTLGKGTADEVTVTAAQLKQLLAMLN